MTRRSALVGLAIGVVGVTAGTGVPATAKRVKDKDCKDFKSQKQAQKFYKKHDPKNDPHNLDGDNDGKACESLP